MPFKKGNPGKPKGAKARFHNPNNKRNRTKKSTHPGNPKNLRPPWKKGQSGNPKGRPKGSGVKDIALAFNALLSQFVDKDKKVRDIDTLFHELRKQSKNGSSAAARTLLGWGLGMPKQMVQVTQGVELEIGVAQELDDIDLKSADNVTVDEAKGE